MNDQNEDDPLAQDDQPAPLGYPVGPPPQHRANRIANMPQGPMPGFPQQGPRPPAPPQPPPPPPEPFTQADSIQLQRLHGGLADINKQLYSGELDEEGAADLKAQVHAQLGPLTARQEATQQKAQQKAQQQMMQQTALQEAMEQQHAVFRAKGLQDRVVTYTDPVTGRTAHLYEQKPNHWAELEFAVAKDDEPPLDNPPASGWTEPSKTMAPGSPQTPPGPLPGQNLGSGEPNVSGAPQTPQDLPSPREAAQQAAAQGQPLTLDQFAKTVQAAQGQGMPQIQQGAASPFTPDSPGGQTQTVRGGVRLGEDPSQMQFNQFGEVQRGAEAKPQNRSAEAALLDRARQAIGPAPQRTGNPAVDAHNAANYQARVADLHHQMVSNYYRHEEHKDLQAAAHAEHAQTAKDRSEENQRREKALSEERQRHEAVQHQEKAEKVEKEKKITDQQHAEAIKSYRTHIATERQKWEANPLNQNKELPDRLKTENEGKEAFRMHQEDTGNVAGMRGDGTANKEAGPTGGLSAAKAALPSSVTHDRARELLPELDAKLAAIPKDAKKDSPEDKAKGLMTAMKGILKKSADNGEPLTVGERKTYDELQQQVHGLLQNYGGAGGLATVKPKAVPPQAAPTAGQPAQPSRDASTAANDFLAPVREAGARASYLLSTPAPKPESLTDADLHTVRQYLWDNGERDQHGAPAVSEALRLRQVSRGRDLTPRERQDYERGMEIAARSHNLANYKGGK
jgi:hypothetical protein